MAVVLHAVVGATFQEPMSLTGRDGQPLDVSGATLTWMAKKRLDDADDDAVLTASTTDGTIVVDDGPGGDMHFLVPPADTDALAGYERLGWTLQIESGGVVVRFPDGFQQGPGVLIVTLSAIA